MVSLSNLITYNWNEQTNKAPSSIEIPESERNWNLEGDCSAWSGIFVAAKICATCASNNKRAPFHKLFKFRNSKCNSNDTYFIYLQLKNMHTNKLYNPLSISLFLATAYPFHYMIFSKLSSLNSHNNWLNTHYCIYTTLSGPVLLSVGLLPHHFV